MKPIESFWRQYRKKLPDNLTPGEAGKAQLSFYAGVHAGVVLLTEAMAESDPEDTAKALNEIGRELEDFNAMLRETAEILATKTKGRG
jgi:hypothetical protein